MKLWERSAWTDWWDLNEERAEWPQQQARHVSRKIRFDSFIYTNQGPHDVRVGWKETR